MASHAELVSVGRRLRQTRDDRADRQVDAPGQDHEELAQGDDADTAGLLEDVADVPVRHEDVALSGRPEEQHHQRQDE